MRLHQKIRKALTLLRSVSRHGHNLISLLDSVRGASAEQAFIDDGNQKISYQALYRQALQTAYVLCHHYHIKGGQKVLLACPNSISFLTILFALSAVGCDIVLISPHFTETTLKARLAEEAYDAVFLTGIPAFTLSVKMVAPEEVLKRINIQTPSYSTSRRKSQLMVLSSGSQGQPRLYKRVTTAFRYYRPFIDIYTQLQLQQYRSTYIAIPFSHGYGLAAVLLSIFLEKRIYCHPAYTGSNLSIAAAKESIDCWIVIPSMIPALYLQKEQLLKGTKAIISGGDRLESSWARQILQGTEVGLYNLYGTSQTGICAIATTEMLRINADTLGRPVNGLLYKFIHCPEKGGNALWVNCAWSAGERGQAFIDTGDLIATDAAGYWFYKGRKDQMQVVGGVNVYPDAIAEQISAYTAVHTVTVYMQKDALLRSCIHARITVHAGFEKNAFDQYLAETFPEYTVHIHFAG